MEDKWNILKREDELFSGIGLTDKQNRSIKRLNHYRLAMKRTTK
ncbi:hypothetical protein SNF32_02430 [Enterococcus mundtii]|nr:hypothetical protein [Enterococcus mundtii]